MNNVALTKMSTTLATWRAAVKRRILSGDSYEKIKETNPSISEADYLEFKIKCESNTTAESSQWGKGMQDLGVHTLGPGGYRVAKPKWSKAYRPSSINTMKSRPGTMSGPGTRWSR